MTHTFSTPELLDQYLANELSFAQRREIEAWIAERPAHKAMLTALEEQAAGVTLEREPDTERWLGVVMQSTQADIRTAPSPLRSLTSRRQPGWKVPLAILAIAAVVGIVVTTIPFDRSTDSIDIHHTGNTYVTAPGQRARVSLADGSSVTLGPKSRLEIARNFGDASRGDASRTVVLDGEAVFTVSQITGAPFLVHTGTTVTKVLGTTFAVRRYANDSIARVVVAEGRVGLQGGHVLNAGDLALIGDNAETMVRRSADIAPYFGWTAGHLTFRDVMTSEVFSDLERWYSVKLQVSSPALLRERLTLSLDNASETEMLNVVAIGLGARMIRTGSTITFVR